MSNSPHSPFASSPRTPISNQNSPAKLPQQIPIAPTPHQTPNPHAPTTPPPPPPRAPTPPPNRPPYPRPPPPLSCSRRPVCFPPFFPQGKPVILCRFRPSCPSPPGAGIPNRALSSPREVLPPLGLKLSRGPPLFFRLARCPKEPMDGWPLLLITGSLLFPLPLRSS